MGLASPQIERAHTVGKPQTGKPRTVIVKIQNYREREATVIRAHQVRDKSFIAYQDHSAHVTQKRQELLPMMHEARRKGQCAFLVYDAVHG